MKSPFADRELRICLTLLVACSAHIGCARNDEFPARPIEVVCPWSAGGGTDLVSRQIASQLEQELDVPVNVVNATGGGGVTGHTRGATATPDGYTLTMTTVELNMLHWRGLTNISPKSFQPIILLNRDDAALFVRADAAWQDIHQLEEEIRKRPGELKASGTAQGGIWHVALVGWLHSQGIPPRDVLWISINGAAPSLQELMAGGVDMACCSVPEAKSLLDAGRIRCLGVMAESRLPSAPNVPTFREQGIDWAMGGWRGVALPNDVPPQRVRLLVETLQRIAESEEFVSFMNNTGFNRTVAGPDGFQALLTEMDAQFGEVLTSEAFRSVRRAPISPMVFPSALAIAGGVLAGSLLVGAAKATASERRRGSLAQLLTWSIAPAWIILFAIVSPWAGFLLTTSVLMVVSMCLLRIRPVVAIATTLVCVPAVYYMFGVILRVSLPRGVFGW